MAFPWLKATREGSARLLIPGLLLGLAASLAALVPATGTARADSTSGYLGRTLVDVLQEFQERGLNLIFTSAVVSDDLRVTVEPRSTRMRAILAEILPPLGLEARPGPGGTLVVVASSAPQGAGTVTGQVLSAVRSLPVAGATVKIVGTDIQVQPREDGTFILSHIPAGRYTLVVEAPGFLTARVSRVRVVAGESLELLVTLHGRPSFVEEVIVTPGRRSIVQQEASGQRVIHDTDALLVPAQGNDMSRVIQLLPGIAAADSTAALHVRGSETQDVALVLDGLELYEPFHVEAYQSPFSFVDGSIVQRTEFLAGGFTADLGDRNGGVIRMSTAGNEGDFPSEVALGTLNSRVSYRAPLSKTSGGFLISARTWYPEALRESIDFGESDLDPRFSDLYFKVSMNISPRTIISTHGLLAHDDLDFTESDGVEQVDNSNTSGYLWARGLHTWTADLLSTTVLSGGSIHRSRKGIAEPDDVVVQVIDQRAVNFVGLRHDMSWQAGDQQLLKFGFDMRRLLAEYDYSTIEEETGTERANLLLRPGGTSFAAYVAYRAGLGRSFATEVGLRWDSQTYIGDAQVSPRLNGIWRLGERSELRLGLGDSYQSQRINELQVEDGVTGFAPAELSRQADLTFHHGFRAGLGLRMDLYYRRLTDIQPHYENNLDKLELFPEAEPDRVLVAPDESRLRGMELLLSSSPNKRFNWWVSYTLSEAEDHIAGRDVPRSWDQRHAGRFLLGYRPNGDWLLSLSGSAHSGWPLTPITANVNTQSDGSPAIEEELGLRNSHRLPMYARLDLKVSRTFTLSRGHVRLDLDLLNLTDRDNACCVDEFIFSLNPDGTIKEQREIDNWLGITPSFTIIWAW